MDSAGKDIPGYEGLYQITPEGHVISVRTGKIRKNVINKQNGYPYVMLSKKSKVRAFTVHRLVAKAFIPNPDSLPEVAHNDNNPGNCHVSNLRWETRKGNEADKVKFGTLTRGSRHGLAKLTDELVSDMRLLWKTGQFNQRELAHFYEVGPDQISRIVNGICW